VIDRCNQSVDVPCQKIISLFVACLSVFILIRRGFKENGSRQEKKQMAGSLVLDPLLPGFGDSCLAA
jgi:hypothetical protein